MQAENNAGLNQESAEGSGSNNWKPFVRGLTELLFYFPFLLLAVVWLLPQSEVYPWLLTLWLPYAAAAWLIHKAESLKFWRRLAGALIIGGVHIAAFAFLRGLTGHDAIWLLCMATAIWMADRGFAMRLHGWNESFSFNRMASCILAYFVLTCIIHWGPDRLSPYSIPVAICGITALFLFLLIINHRHLSFELIDKGKNSAVLTARRRNRWMMAILLGLTVLISIFRQLQQWVEEGLKTAFAALMALFRSESSPPDQEIPSSQEPNALLPEIEPREPALWMKLLEQFMWYVMYAFIIAVVCALLFFIIRKLFRLSEAFWKRLFHTKDINNEDGAAYKDEIESLMASSKWSRNRASRAKGSRLNDVKAWNELSTNSEKIRHLYKQMVRRGISRGYSYRNDQTARETAEALAKRQQKSNGTVVYELDRFVDLYEQARYGGLEPDSREVELYRSRLEEK
jgi:hypothetical protein